MDLEKALEQFDSVETNLRRLEKVWEEMQQIIPSGYTFLGSSPEGLRYVELQRSYSRISNGIPAIDGYEITTIPEDVDAITQMRIEAQEVGEYTFGLRVQEDVEAPTREIDEYRSRFRRARRELVRSKLQELVSEINGLLSSLIVAVPSNRLKVRHEDWPKLVEAFQQIERLAGSQIPQTGRWSDMRRHLHFAEGHDLHDIASMDWPSVRADIEASMYSELEPVPVPTTDLASLVEAKPTGPVTTKLKWDALTAEQFERLLFNLISDAEEYVNPQWLMQTNASDRGRDLSVERIITDELSGTTRQRVIIQAKHWTKKSVRPTDVTDTLTEVSLWEPPPIQSLIIATSGRFTADAVAVIEKHNNEGKRPQIEMWAESHLELLLARRPHLVSGFNLRS
jgi:hypothetical protein